MLVEMAFPKSAADSESPKPAPLNIKHLESMLEDLQAANARLQAYVDREIPQLVAGISVSTYRDAFALMETYDRGWFMNQVYSLESLQLIAYTLLQTTSPYLGADNLLWSNIAKGIDLLENFPDTSKLTPLTRVEINPPNDGPLSETPLGQEEEEPEEIPEPEEFN